MIRKPLLASATLALLAMNGTAFAAEPMSMEDMQKQIELLTKQVDALSQVVEKQGVLISAQKTKIDAQDAALQSQSAAIGKQSAAVDKLAGITPAAGGGNDSGVKITMKPSPKIESADGKYSFQPFGRAHLDFTHFADDDRDHPDGAHFRRARIGFKGDLGEDFNYKAEVDFGGEQTNLKEFYLAYTGMDFADLYVGNFKPSVGLEQNTSTNYMSFIENSPVTNAFTRDEIIGVGLKGGGDNWSWGAGMFNEDAGTNTADDEAWSVDARASVDLLQESDDVLHLGIGGSLRSPNATTEQVRLTGRPAGTGNNMVDTLAINNVDSIHMYGAELAGEFGAFSFQGEYMRLGLDRDAPGAGGTNPDFDGWYLQASYLLTGERRPYKGNTGNFERVKPKTPFSPANGGWGAWEVLARYNELDLNDAGAGITGGSLDTWTLGVNWYLTDNIRMMADYVSTDTDRFAVVPNDDPDVWTLRAQWDF